jgi:hypothetical protein
MQAKRVSVVNCCVLTNPAKSASKSVAAWIDVVIPAKAEMTAG